MLQVLIVDDDDAVREAARFVLEDAGYQVEEAPDGATALITLRTTHSPVIVLLDLKMPTMTGIDLMRLVRQDALLSRHAFILWSASHLPMPPDVREALHVLGTLSLPKPYDLDEMVAVVGQAAERLSTERRA